jgi:hypothetical protein
MGIDPVEPSVLAVHSADGTHATASNTNDLHSFNRYAYANNNPYRFVDPDGRVALNPFSFENLAGSGGGLGYGGVTTSGISPFGAGGAKATSVGNGPKSNGGNAPKHGSTHHNDVIDSRVKELQTDKSVSNIRKNQQQVDVNGNKVGTNRPDVQYDKNGCHNCVEYDTVPRNSTKHGEVIRRNDPNTKVELNNL